MTMLNLPTNAEILQWFIRTDRAIQTYTDDQVADEVNRLPEITSQHLSGEELYACLASKAGHILSVIQHLSPAESDEVGMTRAKLYLAYIDKNNALPLLQKPVVDKVAHRILNILDTGGFGSEYARLYHDFQESRYNLTTPDIQDDPLVTELNLV